MKLAPHYCTKNFRFMYSISTKNWPNLTPKYQLNNCKENYNILTGIMVFCKEVPYIPKCSHSAVMDEIYISRLKLRRWSLEFFCYSFYEIDIFGIWKWGEIYSGFRSEVWLISVGNMFYQILFRVMITCIQDICIAVFPLLCKK
jgi:hypothetical protein